MSRRIAIVAGLTVVLVMGLALPAQACSCAYGDPRESLHEANGAFIGTFLSARDADGVPSGSSDDDTIYTFEVDEAFKGSFGETVDVHAPLSGASCGLEVAPGQDYGLFLYLDGDAWHSSLCSMVEPEDLRQAAAPLPEPDGENPARFLIGGSFGEVRGATEVIGWGKRFSTPLPSPTGRAG